MRLWTCTDHETHYPVGGASIVMAETEEKACELLTERLAEQGIAGPFNLVEQDATKPFAIVLCNGDY